MVESKVEPLSIPRFFPRTTTPFPPEGVSMTAKDTLGQCFACPLNDRQEVPFEGPRDADFCVVGEAPGYNEVKERRPFVGKSGKLLDSILEQIGIRREDCRIGNVVLCGTVNDEVRKATWWQDVLQRCATRREAEEAISKDAVVVALGVSAAEGLLSRKLIFGGNYPQRGALFHDASGRRIIPTWHPAALLRAGGSDEDSYRGLSDADLETLALDIRRAYSLAKGVSEEFHPWIDTTGEPDRFLAFCQKVRYRVAIDVETDGTDPLQAKLLVVGLAIRYLWDTKETTEAISFWWPNATEECKAALRRVLADEKITKVYHNRQFDEQVLQRLGVLRGPVVDTLLLSHVRFPDLRCDLSSVAQTWLTVDPWKSEYELKSRAISALMADLASRGRPYNTWSSGRVQLLLDYNAMDVSATAAVEPLLCEELEKEKLLTVAAIDTALAGYAREMSRYGVLIDQGVREKLRVETEVLRDEAERKLLGIVESGLQEPADKEAADSLRVLIQKEGRFNPSSNKQLQLAFDACGVKVPAGNLTPTGKRSLSKDSLSAVGDHPLSRALTIYRVSSNRVSTYFDENKMDLSFDGRLHVSWKIHGTPTGRWSSGGSGGSSINLQNWPLAMRKMVIAAPGNVLVSADFAQLEYRIIALYSGEESLLELFNSPGRPDLHSVNAARLFGVTWEATSIEGVENAEEIERRKKKRKLLRSLTKNGLYGALYLGTPETIQDTLRSRGIDEQDPVLAEGLLSVSRKQCEEFVKAIPRLWPAVEAWRQWAVKDAVEKCEIRYPLSGRRRVWPMGRVDATQAVNSRVQGFAGDIMNSRFLILTQRLPPEAKIILQIHDSVVIECPEEMGKQVQEILVGTMETKKELNGHTCKFPVDSKIGRNWAEV